MYPLSSLTFQWEENNRHYLLYSHSSCTPSATSSTMSQMLHYMYFRPSPGDTDLSHSSGQWRGARRCLEQILWHLHCSKKNRIRYPLQENRLRDISDTSNWWHRAVVTFHAHTLTPEDAKGESFSWKIHDWRYPAVKEQHDSGQRHRCFTLLPYLLHWHDSDVICVLSGFQRKCIH